MVHALGSRVEGLGCRARRPPFRVWGMGSGAWDLGSGVWGLGSGVWGLGSGVWGLGCRVSGVGCRVSGVGFRGGEKYRVLSPLLIEQAHRGRVLLGVRAYEPPLRLLQGVAVVGQFGYLGAKGT